MAFENLSTSELTTLRGEILAAYRRSLNAQSYGVGGRTLSRASVNDLFKQLQEVDAEIARRSDTTGGFGIVKIVEPS